MINSDERKALLKTLNHTTSVVVGDAYSSNGEITVIINEMYFDTGVSGTGQLGTSDGVTVEEFRIIVLKVIQRIWEIHTADNQIPSYPTGLTVAQINAADSATSGIGRHTELARWLPTGVDISYSIENDNDGEFLTFSKGGTSYTLHTKHFGPPVTYSTLEGIERDPFRTYFILAIVRMYQLNYPDAPELTIDSALDNMLYSTTEPGWMPDVLAEQAFGRQPGSRKTLFTHLSTLNTKLDVTVTTTRVKVLNNVTNEEYSFYYTDAPWSVSNLSDVGDIGGLYFEVIRASWVVLRN